jgi:hypothetical protein
MEQCRVQKSITVPQTVKKFLAFCGSRRFNIVFTRVRLLPLSWDRSIESTYFHSIHLGCIFMFPSHLGSSLPNASFFQISSSNILCYSIISHTCHMPHSHTVHNKDTLKIKKNRVGYKRVKNKDVRVSKHTLLYVIKTIFLNCTAQQLYITIVYTRSSSVIIGYNQSTKWRSLVKSYEGLICNA